MKLKTPAARRKNRRTGLTPLNSQSKTVLASLLALAVAVMWCLPSSAETSCRMVHLWYQSQDCNAFYNEVVPVKSAPGTYFCTCGFDCGYFGLQQWEDGKKVVIFSIWDNSDNSDSAEESNIPEEQRVKSVYADKDVEVARFSGEGTGGRSFFHYDWHPGEKYKFMVTASKSKGWSTFTGYFAAPPDYAWHKLASFATLAAGDKLISDQYCFIEDYKRDSESVKQEREARYQNCWMRNRSGNWLRQNTVQFQADPGHKKNIDAWVEDNGFMLATGGKTQNEHSNLEDELTVEESTGEPPPDF